MSWGGLVLKYTATGSAKSFHPWWKLYKRHSTLRALSQHGTNMCEHRLPLSTVLHMSRPSCTTVRVHCGTACVLVWLPSWSALELHSQSRFVQTDLTRCKLIKLATLPHLSNLLVIIVWSVWSSETSCLKYLWPSGAREDWHIGTCAIFPERGQKGSLELHIYIYINVTYIYINTNV